MANYVATLNAKTELILANPQIGRRFDDIDNDIRGTAGLRHHSYFRPIGDELRVVRILHQRVDAMRNLDQGS